MKKKQPDKNILSEITDCQWLRKKFLFHPSKIKLLGSGSSGKAFQMISLSDGSHKCVKIIVLNSKSEFEFCQNEAKISSRLFHKNIVKLLDFHFEELSKNVFAIYLVYELADGSLNDFIQKNTKIDQILFHDFACQLIQALKHTHDQEIVHFDIKPDNVLMFGDNVVKIGDWGSARTGLKMGTNTMATDSLSMTKLFASAELLELIENNNFSLIENQILKKNWQKIDVYALGLTFLNLLGVNTKDFQTFKKKKGKKYDDRLLLLLQEILLHKLNFHQDWVVFFQKMLAYDSKERFETHQAEDFLKSMNITNNQKDLINFIMTGTGTLDIVFVLDITGSMDQYIEAILNSLKNILAGLKHLTNNRKINVGCVFYKDIAPHFDEDLMDFKETNDPLFLKGLKIFNDHVFVLDLNSDISVIVKKLNEVKCSGGFDECEDLVEGLKVAIDINWTNQSNFRSIVILTDSPAHGRRYYKKAVDYFPENDEKFDNLEEVLRKIALKKIGVIVVEIKENTKEMFDLMEEVYKKYKGNFQKIVLERINDQDYLKQFFEDEILNEIKSSFQQQWNLFFTDKIKDNINWNMQIDWEKNFILKETKKIRFKVHDASLKKESLDFNNLNNLEIESDYSSIWNGNVTKIHVLVGNLREIHLMITEKHKYVVKVPKNGSYNKIEELTGEWKNYLIAGLMANKFNEKLLEMKIIKQKQSLEFLNLIILESVDTIFRGSKYFVCEGFLEGIFVKYNSNMGWVLPAKEGVTLDLNKLTQCFSHFSFQVSKGKMVIVDIQGVANVMTDPAIHSLEGVFGETDLNRYGIYKFLRSHNCNEYCKDLNFKDIKEDLKEYEVEEENQENERVGEKNQNKKIEEDPEGNEIDVTDLNDEYSQKETYLELTMRTNTEYDLKDAMFRARVIIRNNQKHKEYIKICVERYFNNNMKEVWELYNEYLITILKKKNRKC